MNQTPAPSRDEAYWREWFEERAAILEFDGEWPRVVANRLARIEMKAEKEKDRE